jgi:hypothetical protein
MEEKKLPKKQKRKLQMRKKQKRRKAKPHIKPHILMELTIERFIMDLECNKEMFNLVLPELEKKDNERKKIIKRIIKPLRTAKRRKRLDEERIVKINELITNIIKLFRARRAFENNSIVMLVSRYDEFLAEILHLIYKKNPNILKKSNRTLTYKEIISIGSRDKTLDRIISKEIDNLLYKSRFDQLKYLDKEFRLNVVNSIKCIKNFIEVTERRNLFVHSGGKVSSQYISTCKKSNIFLHKRVKEDVRLGVSKKYFEKAYRCLFEIGVVLAQSLLRRIFKKKAELEHFDISLIDVSFNLLKNEEWGLADNILSFAINIPKKIIADDDSYRVFIINKCIALKHLKDKKSMNALLDSVNWKKSGPVFLLAVEVLKGNYDEAEAIMGKMDGKNPRESDFKDWPLFKEFRETDNFKKAFRKIYKKNYKPELKKIVKTLPKP